ncbi:polysaccharide deacetylase family protein [Streptomyces adustus]|uniref:Polysaccharide deacetylase family protein n=1 Tax=Streptomyces adustus TaxID=1609272 RepID=A0A5N8VND8_9ACTN|nr:polysaccharide deacetylase family protein [Streptomyces adustus]MPY36770.1 polysaccharide deacetylase family protein [Streptomyces adustus]
MVLKRKRRQPVDSVVHDHGFGPEPCFRIGYAETSGNDRSRGRRHGWGRGGTQWPVRILLGALTLSVVVASGAAGIERYLYLKYVAPQAPLVRAKISSADIRSWEEQGRGLPFRAPPVVLTFHDVNKNNTSPYALTPEAFDAQLTALEKAGYRTLTAKQFNHYMNGGAIPRRSVLITFDDGTGGLWKYADRILAKHRMHGTIFAITGSMDKHRPYYLTWREIERMYKSGRWDFQSHTRAMHGREPVDAVGTEGAALANRLWLPAEHRRETEAEYQARVRHDLQGSIDDIVNHGMPAPRMFAVPFSAGPDQENIGSQDIQELKALQGQRLLNGFFPLVMTDHSSIPLTASRRAAAAGTVQRVEVFAKTTPDEMLSNVARMVQVAPDMDRPLYDVENWEGRQSHTGFDVFLGEPAPPGAPRYAKADYRPKSSVDWTDYRTTAIIGRLGNGTNQAALGVRTNSVEPVTVVVTQNRAVLLVDGYEVASRALDKASEHTVTIEVRRQATAVVIDGRVKMNHTSDREAATLSGGITIRSGINHEGDQWPAFQALTISPRDATKNLG